MKAISLWQPWASFIRDGLKLFETRSWQCPFTGLIAIHASKRVMTPEDKDFIVQLAESNVIPQTMDYPYGAIIAVCGVQVGHSTNDLAFIRTLTSNEKLVGDYAQDRYAWPLSNAKALRKPVPCRGYQKFWTLDPLIERAVHEQLQ